MPNFEKSGEQSGGIAAARAAAGVSTTTTLTWGASDSSNVAGYTLHWGTAGGSYSQSVDVGNATQYTLTGLDPFTKYFIAVTAYDSGGAQSGYSNEVSNLSLASNFTPVGVSASSDDGDVPANTLDGDLSTRWSAEGDGQWIQYNLGAPHTVRYLAIAFYEGDSRTQSFDIDLSTDGTNWSKIYSGQSSGTTTAFQTFPIPATSAQYVRVVGHGNSVNDWNSLSEVHIGGW